MHLHAAESVRIIGGEPHPFTSESKPDTFRISLPHKTVGGSPIAAKRTGIDMSTEQRMIAIASLVRHAVAVTHDEVDGIDLYAEFGLIEQADVRSKSDSMTATAVSRRRVRSGEYASGSEVVPEGLRALVARDRLWKPGCRQRRRRRVSTPPLILRVSWYAEPAGPAGRRAAEHERCLHPEAQDQLVELYHCIADAASSEFALRLSRHSASAAVVIRG